MSAVLVTIEPKNGLDRQPFGFGVECRGRLVGNQDRASKSAQAIPMRWRCLQLCAPLVSMACVWHRPGGGRPLGSYAAHCQGV